MYSCMAKDSPRFHAVQYLPIRESPHNDRKDFELLCFPFCFSKRQWYKPIWMPIAPLNLILFRESIWIRTKCLFSSHSSNFNLKTWALPGPTRENVQIQFSV